MSDSSVLIHLTPEEAVVLDHILRRDSETDLLTVEDQSEQQALWNLQCVFEKIGNPDWPSLEDSKAALRYDSK